MKYIAALKKIAILGTQPYHQPDQTCSGSSYKPKNQHQLGSLKKHTKSTNYTPSESGKSKEQEYANIKTRKPADGPIEQE